MNGTLSMDKVNLYDLSEINGGISTLHTFCMDTNFFFIPMNIIQILYDYYIWFSLVGHKMDLTKNLLWKLLYRGTTLIEFQCMD